MALETCRSTYVFTGSFHKRLAKLQVRGSLLSRRQTLVCALKKAQGSPIATWTHELPDGTKLEVIRQATRVGKFERASCISISENVIMVML